MKKPETRVQITSRPGTFFVVSRNWSKLHLMDADGKDFYVSPDEVITKEDVQEHRKRLQVLKPVTPLHLRPDRTPVESDLHWQAFIRRHGIIRVLTHPDAIFKVLDRIELETGIRYDVRDTAITMAENYWRCLGLTICWGAGHGIPFDLPKEVKVKHYESAERPHYWIHNTAFALDLLKLGLPLGTGGLRDEDVVQMVQPLQEGNRARDISCAR